MNYINISKEEMLKIAGGLSPGQCQKVLNIIVRIGYVTKKLFMDRLLAMITQMSYLQLQLAIFMVIEGADTDFAIMEAYLGPQHTPAVSGRC